MGRWWERGGGRRFEERGYEEHVAGIEGCPDEFCQMLVTFTHAHVLGQVQSMNEEFLTKVTPTVTNVTHANMDKQSLKDSCRHTVTTECP